MHTKPVIIFSDPYSRHSDFMLIVPFPSVGLIVGLPRLFVTTQRNGKKHEKARTATILSRTVTALSSYGFFSASSNLFGMRLSNPRQLQIKNLRANAPGGFIYRFRSEDEARLTSCRPCRRPYHPYHRPCRQEACRLLVCLPVFRLSWPRWSASGRQRCRHSAGQSAPPWSGR